jgi:hypothetical protein
MASKTFWTRRFTGIALVLGCVLFLVGIGLIPRDEQGTFLYFLSQRAQLLLIAKHPTLWWWASVLFIGAALVTLVGFVQLTLLLRGAGDQAFSSLGLIALVFGDVLWVIQLAFRLSIDIWAAQETAKTGVLPALYLPLTWWITALFVVYTILAFLAAAAYGGGLVFTRLLPPWLGWATIVYSLAGLGLSAAMGNAPPVFHYLLPMVMGILLLLPDRRKRESVAQECKRGGE